MESPDFCRQKIILELFEIEAVKFGEFTLKSNILSPIYFDLRVIISYPDLMVKIADLLWQAASTSTFQNICGVPYTALPIATCMSIAHKYPLVMRRKEAKDYGTKKLIEGRWNSGDVCLVVEDVVTTGSSVMETVKDLRSAGLTVRDAVVLLDRQQGGVRSLQEANIRLHSVFGIDELLRELLSAGKIDPMSADKVEQFIRENQTSSSVTPAIGSPLGDTNKISNTPVKTLRVLSYSERSALCRHPLSKKLFAFMDEKKTNLAFSADVDSCARLLQLADEVGPYICVLKTHVDTLKDFTLEAIAKLRGLADRHHFLIFEDRKFADIGHTVQEQYRGGLYHISDWSDMVTVHALPGPGIIEGLKQVNPTRACILLAQMSSAQNLLTESYTQATLKLADDFNDFVLGFICTTRVSQDPAFIHFTPGVSMDASGDQLGQQYLTPDEIINNRKCDVIIVGRGILQADNAVEAAKKYQQAGYAAYTKCLSS